MQRVGEAAIVDQAQVRRQPAAKYNARFGLALARDGAHLGPSGEEIHDRVPHLAAGLVVNACHDIDILDRFAPPPYAPPTCKRTISGSVASAAHSRSDSRSASGYSTRSACCARKAMPCRILSWVFLPKPGRRATRSSLHACSSSSMLVTCS